MGVVKHATLPSEYLPTQTRHSSHFDDHSENPSNVFFHFLDYFLSTFTKRVACPEGADLGFGGFHQQAKIRLGSTQTLLATTTNH